MKIPYNKVHVRGQILFAARGGAIHTFNLTDGTHISSWKHPDVDKVADSIKAINEAKAEAALAAETDTPVTESEGPPAKRQKLGDEDESAPVAAEAEASASTPATAQDDKPRSGHVDGRGKKGKGKAGKDVDNGKTRFARVPDRPVITHLTSTSDGSHLVAVTGHDKIVWVFKHDGNGQIEELSRRYEHLSLLFIFRKRHVLKYVNIEPCLSGQAQSLWDPYHKSSAPTNLEMSTPCL
jgi:tRNA (guanine-N(7)-)-methyltransferase subunit TRM82